MRPQMLHAAAALACALLVAPAAHASGTASTVAPDAPAAATPVTPAPDPASVSVMDLAVAGPLGDRVMGDAAAPVTVIEYASMTCSHCAAFNNETFPAFKAKYVDTGKVRYILREFPLDPLASAAFMLARCAPEADYYPIVETMFAEQKNWAFVEDPGAALLKLLSTKGFDEAKFNACLTDKKLFDHVTAVRARADEKFAISGTPTFFFNGQRETGVMTIEEIDAVLAPML